MRSFADRYGRIFPHYKDTPEKRYFKITTMMIIGMILFMIIAVLIAFLVSIRGPEEVLVPNVISAPEDEIDLIAAMRKLQEKGLIATIQVKHASTFKKGAVMDQRPRAGAIVKAGRHVLLTVSEGPVVSSVGEYVGKTLSAVKIELQELFSTDGEPLIRIKEPVMYIDNDAAVGVIVEQHPKPGTEVRGNEITYVDLVVSKGPKGEQLSVSDYRGKPFDLAIGELAHSNIPFTFTVRPAKTGEEAGIIVSQDPSAGEETIIELTMTEPKGLEKGLKFGIFEADLVRYPILVDLELVEQRGDEKRTILSVKYPGGPVRLPYIVEDDAEVILYVNKVRWGG